MNPLNPPSPYALSKSSTTSAKAKSTSKLDDFEIIDNFDQLPKKAKDSKPKKPIIDDKDAAEAIELAQDKDAGDENAWLQV